MRQDITDKCLKWVRVAAYMLMGTAGLLLLLSPVLTDVYPGTVRVMSGFMLIGGYLCATGSVLERWWGEYMGIPLLSSAFAVFSVIAVTDTWDEVPFLAAANLCLLAGVALALLTRWKEVRTVYQLALHLAQKDAGKGVTDV